MGVKKPYKFIWFRDTHATEPYEKVRLGWCRIVSIVRIGVHWTVANLDVTFAGILAQPGRQQAAGARDGTRADELELRVRTSSSCGRA
jgi:hypothetical protein